MSFTDEENKLIEEEENKAEEEIRARFKSFFSEEELLSSAQEFDKKDAETKDSSSSVASLKKNQRSDSSKKDIPKKNRRPRISGPDYSLRGHKIISDSNYRPEQRKTESKRRNITSHRVSERVFLFTQNSIPEASNELTRRAVINSTRKVRKREKKLLNAKNPGLFETSKKAQVSIYSGGLAEELYIDAKEYPDYDHDIKKHQEPGKLSRQTIERLLNDNAAQEEISKKQAEEIRAAQREARNRAIREREKAPKKSATRKKPVRQRTPVSYDTSRIASIDNSKKSVKARQKASRKSKASSPAKVIVNFVVLALIVAICIFGFLGARMVFDDTPMNPNDVTKYEFTVDAKTTDEVVAAFLVNKKMVESELIYKLRAKIFDADYVEGTYELSPSFSTEKIINTLSGFDYSAGN